MICKWCNAKLSYGQQTCSQCGKTAVSLVDGNEIWDLEQLLSVNSPGKQVNPYVSATQPLPESAVSSTGSAQYVSTVQGTPAETPGKKEMPIQAVQPVSAAQSRAAAGTIPAVSATAVQPVQAAATTPAQKIATSKPVSERNTDSIPQKKRAATAAAVPQNHTAPDTAARHAAPDHQKQKARKLNITPILFVVCIILVITTVFFFAKYHKMSDRVTLLQKQITNVNADNQNLQEQLDGKISDEELLAIQQENEDLETENASLQQENETLQAENTSLQQENESLTEQNTEMQQTADSKAETADTTDTNNESTEASDTFNGMQVQQNPIVQLDAGKNDERGTVTYQLSMALGDGIEYQWQSSDDGVSWSDIADANDAAYTCDASDTQQYRCIVVLNDNAYAVYPENTAEVSEAE